MFVIFITNKYKLNKYNYKYKITYEYKTRRKNGSPVSE